MSWLRERRPPEPGPRAICHGDFHPQNILSEGGVVTGVLDWPNALVADPAYDVASTRIILALTPIALSGVPAALRWVASFVRLMLLKRYLAGMRRRRPLAAVWLIRGASAMPRFTAPPSIAARRAWGESPEHRHSGTFRRHFARPGVPAELPRGRLIRSGSGELQRPGGLSARDVRLTKDVRSICSLRPRPHAKYREYARVRHRARLAAEPFSSL